jgi:HD-like signal output (HDOD) protein
VDVSFRVCNSPIETLTKLMEGSEAPIGTLSGTMATRPISVVQGLKAWRPEQVPPFPAVALKALNLMAGTDTSLLELCNLIRTDAAFTTEVLRIASSPLVSFSKNITNVMQASMLLGFRRLRSMVITVGLRAYLAESFTPVLESCWRHSVATAILAERTAKACLLDKDFAYTAGVMHDIGRVVLAVSMPREYARVIEQGADQPRDVLPVERTCCGIDHCEAGGALVRDWGLPEAFFWVTACHHDSDAGPKRADSIVSLSCVLADSLGFGAVGYRTPRSCKAILSEFPEAARLCLSGDDQELASEIKNEITLIETA